MFISRNAWFHEILQPSLANLNESCDFMTMPGLGNLKMRLKMNTTPVGGGENNCCGHYFDVKSVIS